MTSPIKMTEKQFKRLTKNGDTMNIQKTTSELMSEYVRIIEKHLGRRLTRDEALGIRSEALMYAKMVRPWLLKPKQEKGQSVR